MIRQLLSVLGLLGLVFSLQTTDLHDFVTEYESFEFKQQSQVRKRSADNFELKMTLGGQEFTLLLEENHGLTQYITLESSRSFLKGSVQGHPDSMVRLSMEESFLEGLVMVNDESFYIENLEVSAGQPNTVVYKASSVKRDTQESLKARCKTMEPLVLGENEIATHVVSNENHEITKRADTKDCRIALIADITFFGKYGANSQSTMVSTLNTIEGLYLNQVNTGLPVVYTHVVTSASDATGLGAPSTSINSLLTQLATAVKGNKFTNFPTNVCLVHLFTYQNFGGTLGLAYTGSTKTNTIGGICSGSGYNTGVTSFQTSNRESGAVVKIVTAAHEIGHNFGSKHDTEHDTPPGNLPECNPTDKFMMFPSVNTGNNAQKFSTCSLYSVTETIKVKGTCFVTRTSTTPTAAPTTAPTSAPTTKPTTAPSGSPTTAPTSAPTTKPTTAPTTAPTTPPSSTDQCATDTRLGGKYVSCPFQPSGFSPCVLFCAEPTDTSSCFYFTTSTGSYLNKNAGSSCGTGLTCNSAGQCGSSTPTAAPTTAPTSAPTTAPTRAPTLAPTTAPTTTSAPTTTPTTTAQPQCPSWAATPCSTNDCQLSCSYSGFCFFYKNRPDGTVCGGTGRCVAGTCRAASSVEGKECDPADACCDEVGNLRPLGYVCRASATLCDIEEVCDPNSSRPSLCPEDLVRPGGSPCDCTDSYDPSTCASSCGSGDFLGVCGKAQIESCTGKTCADGTTCTILKGEAICLPDEIRTCQNNCGQSALLTVGCFCDESCVDSGDCCDDYEQFCVVSRGGDAFSKGTPSWVWGVVGAVIALVVVGIAAAIGFFYFSKNRKHQV